MAKKQSGFTIVELLIVIVVIAILAAVSMVAYSGMQQRANNARTTAAVKQVITVIQGYIATNGSYPTELNVCIVPAEDGSCTIYSTDQTVSTNATLTNNLKTIGTLPTSVPTGHANFSGIVYHYAASRTFDGAVRPAVIAYSLRGNYQKCGISPLANSGGTVMVSSTTGYTNGIDGSGYTGCFISITGP